MWKSLIPHEHGAYGQLLFPLIGAFAVSGPSVGGVLIALAAIAGFLAHEPALLLLGRRGPRAYRERRDAAQLWLWCCVGVGAVAAVALVAYEGSALWPAGVPLVPGAALVTAVAARRDKSWYGEAAAALTFSGMAVPVCLFAGASVQTAAGVAMPFALLFVCATLSVHVVILQGRGREPRAARTTQAAALTVAMLSTAALAILARTSALAGHILLAAAPGLLTDATVALLPPKPTRLRDLGWALIGVSVLTTVLVVATAR